MPTTGDILQIKMFQEFVGLSGDVLNVFYYQCGSTPAPWSLSDAAADFVDSWEAQITDAFLSCQSSGLRHTRLEVNNLMDYEGDYFNRPYDVPRAGNVPEDYGNPSSAWSIELLRTNRTTRNGSKRVAGVPETYVNANTATPTALAVLDDLVNILAIPVFIEYSSPLTVELTPVILKSPVLTTTPPTVINPVSGALFRGVSTQASRKQLLG